MTDQPNHDDGALWENFVRRVAEVFETDGDHGSQPGDLDLSIVRYFQEAVDPPVRLTISRSDFDAYVRSAGVELATKDGQEWVNELWGEIDESLETDTEDEPAVTRIGLRRRSIVETVYFEERT